MKIYVSNETRRKKKTNSRLFNMLPIDILTVLISFYEDWLPSFLLSPLFWKEWWWCIDDRSTGQNIKNFSWNRREKENRHLNFLILPTGSYRICWEPNYLGNIKDLTSPILPPPPYISLWPWLQPRMFYVYLSKPLSCTQPLPLQESFAIV